jgi:hypothetical protein
MPEVNARTVVTGLLVIPDRIAVHWHARKQWFGSASASWEEALRVNHTDVSGMAGGKAMLQKYYCIRTETSLSEYGLVPA